MAKSTDYLNIKKTFVRLGKRMSSLLYEPITPDKNTSIAILVMHSDEDYLTFPTGNELSKRGYTVLCANVMNKEGILYSQNEKMSCVYEAILFLKNLPNIKKVILFGHSGGATLMTAYQAVAEKGPEIFQGENYIFPYDGPDQLIPADGLLLIDSNWGNAIMQLLSLDPAIKNVQNGLDLDPEWNLFNPKNGFLPTGSSFSNDFIRKYQRAQSQLNHQLLSKALERLKIIESGDGNFLDDEPFIIAGAAQSFFNNKLFAQDIRLMSHTVGCYDLIHKDGSLTNEVIYSVRRPENPTSMTPSFWRGARMLTVKNYLSSYAVRTEESFGYDESQIWGIDWQSTYNSPVGNVTHIDVPTLVMGMTGGWEYLASEQIYKMSASQDKTVAFVEGASHKLTPAKAYEDYPGQFGDTLKLVHDYIDSWLGSGRFQ